jgi:hypothetical protein
MCVCVRVRVCVSFCVWRQPAPQSATRVRVCEGGMYHLRLCQKRASVTYRGGP